MPRACYGVRAYCFHSAPDLRKLMEGVMWVTQRLINYRSRSISGNSVAECRGRHCTSVAVWNSPPEQRPLNVQNERSAHPLAGRGIGSIRNESWLQMESRFERQWE